MAVPAMSPTSAERVEAGVDRDSVGGTVFIQIEYWSVRVEKRESRYVVKLEE